MSASVGLRQVVLAAKDLEATSAALVEAFGVRQPFADPDVEEFGLRNAVFAMECGFLEVVSPAIDGTAAGRFVSRSGDGGYMVIVQTDSMTTMRTAMAAQGISPSWETDRPEIFETHIHPRDAGGTLLSVAQTFPSSSWRPAGPEWTAGPGPSVPGRLLGATIATAEPEQTAARWAALLGVIAADGTLRLDGSEITFVRDGSLSGLVAVDLAMPSGPATVDIANVTFTVLALEAPHV